MKKRYWLFKYSTGWGKLLKLCLLPFQSERNFRIAQNRMGDKQYKTKGVFLFPKQESSSRIKALRNVKGPSKKIFEAIHFTTTA